jgi:lysophospholipase L1-like esterase
MTSGCPLLRRRFLAVWLISCTLLSACAEDAIEEPRAAAGRAGNANTAEAGTGVGGSNAGGSNAGGTWSPGDAGFAGLSRGGGDTSNGGAVGAGTGGVSLGGAAGASTGGVGGGATNQQPTTIWIAGDSTVKTYAAGNTQGYNGTSLEGWGQELAPFFNADVTIDNQAIGGRSVASFMWTVATDGAGAPQCVDDQGTPQFQLNDGNKIDTSQWAKVKAGMKSGDFLLIQFGHNDETHTCPRFVNVTDYATYLGFMADTAIAQGATPIFVTPMGHRSFTGSKFNNTLLPYAQSMKGAAALESLEVVDLNLRSGEYYEQVGNAFLTTNIFDGGTTHFVKAGAVEMASLIAGELEKQGGRLATYLK